VRFLAAVALTIVAAGCRRTPTPHARDEFVRRLSWAFEAEHSTVRYDPERDTLVVTTDGHPTTVNLGNLFEEYRVAPDDGQRAIIARVVKNVRTMNAPLEPLEKVRPRLLPLVREGLYFEGSTLEMEARGSPNPVVLAHRPITDLMHVGLAVDSDTGIRFVGNEDLQRWNAGLDDLMVTAIANLRARSGGDFQSPQPGVYRSPWHDNYDTSRLLLTDKIRSLELDGAPVAMMPNRDTLLITGDRDAAGLLAMADLVTAELAKPRPMHSIALRLEGDRWVSYLPSANEVVRKRFKRLGVASLQSLYDEQTKLLDRVNEKRGVDIFVGNCTAIESKDHTQVLTLSVWTKTVLTLMPRTDKIAFMDPDQPKEKQLLGTASWERVNAVAGPLLKPVGMSPMRYRVDGFPTPKQLEAMGLKKDPFEP
jgi:hypothetical protein